MLTIWSNSDATLLSKTFGKVLRSFRPNVPEHTFVEFDPDTPPPTPEPGCLVLVCGTKPLDALQRAGRLPKGRTVTSMREKHIPFNGGWYQVTYDPMLLANEPDKADVLEWDVRLAVRLMRTGSTAPVIGVYKYVNDYGPMISRIEAEFDKTGVAVEVACDTETMGFHPWYPDRDLVSISFTLERGTAEVLYLGPQPHPVSLIREGVNLYDQILWLLNSPKVKTRFANGKFDLLWILVKWGMDCTNFKFDTTQVGSLLDENRSNGLSLHAKIFTDLGGYDAPMDTKYDKGHMERVPTDDLLTYAGGDTDATQQVADVLKEELLEDPQLTRFYINIMQPAVKAFVKVENRGMVIDLPKYQALSKELAVVIDHAQNVAMDLLPVKMRIKYRDKIDDQLKQGKSPLLPSILKEFFFTPHGLNLKPLEKTEKTDQPSMAKSHLMKFENVPEAVAMVAALKDLDGASKTKSTFVDGFLKHLRPDGRFHPTYMLFHGDFEGRDEDSGTVTGRLAAKDPAIQVLPKKTKWAKRIRDCFTAPEGKVVVSLDYSQGELRVVACVANEKNMIKAYEAGKDLHALTGSQLAQVPYEEFKKWEEHEDEKLVKMFADLRQQAKAGNFGLLYGMGAAGFQAYAWANYGLKLTLEEAEDIRIAFFVAYPGLTTYHDNQRRLVKLHEMVRSPLGRIRHLPTIRSWASDVRSTAERQAINSPIQATLTDMMIWAIALIEDAYPNGDIEVVAMIHDALIAYVPATDPAHYCKQMRDVMANLPFADVGWHPQLAFPVDAEAGGTLASMKKLKLIA